MALGRPVGVGGTGGPPPAVAAGATDETIVSEATADRSRPTTRRRRGTKRWFMGSA
jgi:hypothetical protein